MKQAVTNLENALKIVEELEASPKLHSRPYRWERDRLKKLHGNLTTTLGMVRSA